MARCMLPIMLVVMSPFSVFMAVIAVFVAVIVVLMVVIVVLMVVFLVLVIAWVVFFVVVVVFLDVFVFSMGSVVVIVAVAGGVAGPKEKEHQQRENEKACLHGDVRLERVEVDPSFKAFVIAGKGAKALERGVVPLCHDTFGLLHAIDFAGCGGLRFFVSVGKGFGFSLGVDGLHCLCNAVHYEDRVVFFAGE